ncbi:divalent-cation tolerance protein CutA [Methylopila sp. Yamaguchi]|uniref:divalent-cation tolerance protein CutA n=1 Tax=Methylopila sp. Yamaguchi TaxID=1437817 RepID=UPI000CB1D539|nr:divalent-cation tolerance protein CutA [Methylopila sp. Yamaguchi]GBD49514.1 CutA1 divalent ion tolerance protein [Methylopila sp. Yamaguchi]
MTEFVIVTTTVADAGAAEAIARTAVERRLAACAGIVARRSVYRWKGALEMADELAVELKTLASVAPALEAAIRELHPYELPEVVVTPIVGGSEAYLAWVREGVDVG